MQPVFKEKSLLLSYPTPSKIETLFTFQLVLLRECPTCMNALCQCDVNITHTIPCKGSKHLHSQPCAVTCMLTGSLIATTTTMIVVITVVLIIMNVILV